MKVWYGYSSEHSMNLVMIGWFKEVSDATISKQVIEHITKQVEADIEAGIMVVGEQVDRFTEAMLELLGKHSVHTIGPAELEQFAYEVSVDVEDDRVVITTEEADISAFLKVLLNKGARVEVYSAHDYPGTGHGRGGKSAMVEE